MDNNWQITKTQKKKSTIKPQNIIESRNDVEDIMEFYNDDTDIKENGVDLFSESIVIFLKSKRLQYRKFLNRLCTYKEGKFITKTLQSELLHR
jgi:hypothetical protein